MSERLPQGPWPGGRRAVSVQLPRLDACVGHTDFVDYITLLLTIVQHKCVSLLSFQARISCRVCVVLLS